MAEQVQIPGLAELRIQIDEVDSQLLELLNRRARLSLAVGEAKAHIPGSKVFDPTREAQLLAALAARNPGPLTRGHIVSVWREIMSASRALQKPCSVAYLGPEGTFSYFASVDFLGNSMTFIPCRDFAEIFRKVYAGECDMGVVPLENSIHGTVVQNFDLFSQYQVRIQAEFYSRIANSLLSRSSSLEDIRTVYSHPQPLGQCSQWLKAHLPDARLVSVESTAAAAYRASQEEHSAAIGHHSLGEKLHMTDLADNIEDESSNWTRFVLITAGDMSAQRPRNASQKNFKSSLIFTVSDKAGALSSVLGIFTSHQVNMTKLESRPLRGSCWKYIFFADVECDLTDPYYSGLIQEVSDLCTSVRVLGCYPEGPRLDSTANTTGF
jgi:chorismate mutase/prephenate dehydratase